MERESDFFESYLTYAYATHVSSHINLRGCDAHSQIAQRAESRSWSMSEHVDENDRTESYKGSVEPAIQFTFDVYSHVAGAILMMHVHAH